MKSDGFAMVLGHLGQDPRINTTPNGKTVMSLSVAINKKKPNSEEQQTLWCPGELWNPRPDQIEQLKKGAYVRMTGSLAPDGYVGKDGVKHEGFVIKSANVLVISVAGEGRPVPTEPDEEGEATTAAAPATAGEESPVDDMPF